MSIEKSLAVSRSALRDGAALVRRASIVFIVFALAILVSGAEALTQVTADPDRSFEIFKVDDAANTLTRLTNNRTGGGLRASVSKDGGFIAFISRGDLTGDNHDQSAEVFVMSSDGTDVRQLTSSTLGSASSVEIAGNGSKIVFASSADLACPTCGNPDLSQEIFVVDTDGTGLRQLTSSASDSIGPSLSGDATRIVFVSSADLSPELPGNADFSDEIFTIRPDGTGLRQLTSSTAAGSVAPSVGETGIKAVFQADADPAHGTPGNTAPDGEVYIVDYDRLMESDVDASGTVDPDPPSCPLHSFVIDTGISGINICAQPDFTDLAGSSTDGQVPDELTLTRVDSGKADYTIYTNDEGDLPKLRFTLPFQTSPDVCVAGWSNLSGMDFGNIPLSGITTVEATAFQGALLGNATSATTASALASDPEGCGANMFVTDIAASGTLTCAQPSFSSFPGSVTDAQIPDTITATNYLLKNGDTFSGNLSWVFNKKIQWNTSYERCTDYPDCSPSDTVNSKIEWGAYRAVGPFGQANHILFQGYNWEIDGGKITSGEPSIKLAMENSWFDGTVNRQYQEWNLDHWPAAGHVWRPLGVYIDTGGGGSSEYLNTAHWQFRTGPGDDGTVLDLNPGGSANIGVFSFQRNAKLYVRQSISRAGQDTTSQQGTYSRLDLNLDGTSARAYAYTGNDALAQMSDFSANNEISALSGSRGLAYVTGSSTGTRGVANYMAGVEGRCWVAPAGSSATSVQECSGGYFQASAHGSGTNAWIGGLLGIHILSPEIKGAGISVNTGAGIQIADQRGYGTNRFGAIVVDPQTAGSGPQHRGNIVMLGGDWNSGHLALGNVGMSPTSHIWNSSGALRFKAADAPFFASNYDVEITSSGVSARAFMGNASTATALATNGADCAPGQVPLGIDASGSAEGCFTVTTPSSADTLTNKTLDASGAGNTLTIPWPIRLGVGRCDGSVAALDDWSLPAGTAAVAGCIAGANVSKGTVDFPEAGSEPAMQTTMGLPEDTSVSAGFRLKLVWLTSATSGSAKWSAQTSCAAMDGTETDDPSWNPGNSVTTAAPQEANRVVSSDITLPTAGCEPGEMLHIKVYRDANDPDDTIDAEARVISTELLISRAM